MLSNFQLETTDIGFAEEPVLNHRCPQRESGGGISCAIPIAGGEICFFWQECRTNEKALRPEILLEKGANPNTELVEGELALTAAAIQSGCKDVVEHS